MAYAFVVTSIARTIDNHRHIAYTIVETDVDPTDEWNIDVPSDRPARMTTYEGELTDADAATTLQPELGLVASWTTDGIGHLLQEETAIARVRNDVDVRFMSRNGKLYGRSTPDAHADEITTRVTIVEGN